MHGKYGAYFNPGKMNLSVIRHSKLARSFDLTSIYISNHPINGNRPKEITPVQQSLLTGEKEDILVVGSDEGYQIPDSNKIVYLTKTH